MGVSLVLPWLVWAAAAQTQIAPTAGPAFAADVLSISDTLVELDVAGQPSQVPVGKLRRIQFAASDSPAAADSAGGNSPQQVTLIDGSVFRFQSFSLDEAKAHFQLTDGTSLSVPASSVHRVQLQSLSEPQWTQWQAIADSRISADLLILVRSPEVLEKLEGIISRVTPTAVSFEFSGQEIEAPLAKLAGMRFFTAGPPAAALPESAKLVAIVGDRAGNRWLASGLSLPRGQSQLQLTLQAGVELSLPLEQMGEIDFSAGSLQFLAELQPLSRQARGGLAAALKLSAANELFGARSAAARRGAAPAAGPSLEFIGSGVVEYRVPDEFTRLQGAVELRPTGSRFTPCVVTVALENQTLWETRLSASGQKVPVDVPVRADGRLRIEVAADAPTAVGDVVLWHELRFVK